MKTKCYHNINITLNARITETYLHLELIQDLNSEHKIKPRINPWRSFNISRPTSMIIQTENRIKCTFYQHDNSHREQNQVHLFFSHFSSDVNHHFLLWFSGCKFVTGLGFCWCWFLALWFLRDFWDWFLFSFLLWLDLSQFLLDGLIHLQKLLIVLRPIPFTTDQWWLFWNIVIRILRISFICFGAS